MKANEKQVGGEHYKAEIQHWDFVTLNDIPYLMGCATKYVSRWQKKHQYPELLRQIAALFRVSLPTPQEDLLKSVHYVEKTIELYERGVVFPPKTKDHIISAEEFCKSNSLGQTETEIIRLLTQWTSVGELEHAIKLIHMVADTAED